MDRSNKIFLSALLFSFIAVVFSTANNFLFAKDYDFVLEAPCDSTKQSCFYRDCSSEECPPNNLENYRVLHINAGDFHKCLNNSCIPECDLGIIACTETICGESEEDVCSG